MEQYKFTYYDKVTIVEGGVDYVCYWCPDDGVYLKYRGVSDSKCPWCGTTHDPIQNIRELRKELKKELGHDKKSVD